MSGPDFFIHDTYIVYEGNWVAVIAAVVALAVVAAALAWMFSRKRRDD